MDSWKAEDIVRRAAILARLWNAWPSAGACTEGRLMEYVNATRRVPTLELESVVDAAIERGGEFMPSAGDVVTRAAEHLTGQPPHGQDRDEWFRYREAASKWRAKLQPNTHAPPIRSLPSGEGQRALEALQANLIPFQVGPPTEGKP